MTELYHTFCSLCLANCGLEVAVENGRITKIRGERNYPHNRGGLCIKGRLAHQIATAPGRLTEPLVRSGGRLKTASWSAALERAAQGLTSLKEKYGPQSLAFYQGTANRFLAGTMTRAFGRLYGTPNVSGTWSLCVGPKILGFRAVFGRPDFAMTDPGRARLIVLFGTNPFATRWHRYYGVVEDILAAHKAGARLVAVDPRVTPLTRRADLHLAINPGTDSWLILALIAGLIRDNGFDRDFVARHCLGFEDLAASLAGFDFDQAARVTGLARADIDHLTDWLAQLHPAALDRREGLIHQANGTAANQALAVLTALTGSVDTPGGLLMSQRPSLETSLGLPPLKEPPLWGDDFPLAKDASGRLTPAMARGRIRGLMTLAGNPMTAWPDTAQTRAALKGLDFLAVNDLFPNETSELADVVFPGALFLEKGDLEPGLLKKGAWLRSSGPVIDPPGSARAEWQCLTDLARALGHHELDWITDADSIIDRILADSNLELRSADLRRGRQLAAWQSGAYRRHGFHTPSGKVELKASLLEQAGYEPLPRPGDACPVSEEFPYRLITGHRVTAYYHSGQRNQAELRRLGGEAAVEISPQLAARTGLKPGGRAVVETRTGRLCLPVRIVSGMNPQTVALPHGWPGEENANFLVPGDVFDPPAATPAYRALPCRIGPAREQGSRKTGQV